MSKILIIIATFFAASYVFAANQVVNLTVDYKTVNYAGKSIKAIAVNNQIPAPTLHFKQGDHVTINVHNKLNEETAIHWHGIILPWQMDGVLGVNQHGIRPGTFFQYKFVLNQSGTYWYHAHAGLQEQQGLYGALIIDPPKHPSYRYTKDYVIVLSDWSNTYPENILSNLKKEGDYYSPRFPLQPSLTKFIHDYRKASFHERQLLVDDYKMMQQMRMSIYDISDVAYDAFLLNGQPKSKPWTAAVKVGDVVRLRIIGAGGSTVFHVKIPDATMKLVHVQGNDVEPYTVDNLSIAPGETYDVLVNIERNVPYIIYAESIDTVGAAYGALVTAPYQNVNYKKVAPFPEPLPVTRGMMAMMMGKMHQGSVPSNKPIKKLVVKEKTSHDTNMVAAPMSHDMMSMDHEKSEHTSHLSMEEQMKLNPDMKMDGETSKGHPTLSVQSAASGVKTHHEMNGDTTPTSSHAKITNSSGHANHSEKSNNMAMNGGMTMTHGEGMNHSMGMTMPTEPSIIGDSISPPSAAYMTSVGTKYEHLKAAVRTNDPDKPIAGVINMELFGYMDRYIWFINGVPEHKAKPIIFEPNKRYRIVFTNTSMMRHPMHIHGHWFILRKGNGAYDALLHTIEVAPGATITADVDTDASGQWLFHCHLLYHMMTGMSRVLQYSTLIELTHHESKPQDIIKQTPYINRPIVRVDEVRPIDKAMVRHPMAHNIGLWLATFLDIGANPVTNMQRITYRGLYGPDYNKLELFTNDAEVSKGQIENADMDVFYWRLLDQFWAIKGGINYFYRPATSPYWRPGIGIEGLMPYYIDTGVRGYFYRGSAQLDVELSRDTQITNNFFIRLGVRSILASKTVTAAAIGSGLNQMRYIVRPYYRLMPGLNVVAEFEREETFGAYRNILRNTGESTSENSLTLGFSILF